MLTPEERLRIKHHLGMPLTALNPTISAGVSLPTPLLVRVDAAMDMLLTGAEPIVRRDLQRCDDHEELIDRATVRLQASSVDGIDMREDEIEKLREAYMDWVGVLENDLGVCMNPYAARASFRPRPSGPNVGMIGVAR